MPDETKDPPIPTVDESGRIRTGVSPAVWTADEPPAAPQRETVDESGRVQNPAKEPVQEPPKPPKTPPKAA